MLNISAEILNRYRAAFLQHFISMAAYSQTSSRAKERLLYPVICGSADVSRATHPHHRDRWGHSILCPGCSAASGRALPVQLTWLLQGLLPHYSPLPCRELTTPADFSINCSFTSVQISVGCLSWVSFQLPPSSCLFLIHAPTCLCTWLGSELTAFLTSLSVIPFAFCSRSTMVTQVRWEPHSRNAAMPVLPPARPSSSVGCSTGQSFADGKHRAAQVGPHCVGSSSRCTQNLVQGN